MGLEFKPVWFDSMGAKSSCTLITAPGTTIVIDPGVAVMQPSFPASLSQKLLWEAEGRSAIKRALKEADVVVISHYHHDHYLAEDVELYSDKLLLAKNPNRYINDSQRARAERFFSKICKFYGDVELNDVLGRPQEAEYHNPLSSLRVARETSFGDYDKRRKELLGKGYEWFMRRAEKWSTWPVIPEVSFKKIKVMYPEDKEVSIGGVRLRFTEPLFHGVEFSRVGWVFATIVEHRGESIMHTSDINGPIIEDYAELIIREDPDVLILDGPMTYMFGYMLNRVNLSRAIRNALRIVSETSTRLIIYDHHLPREAKFRERTKEVWEAARRCGKRLLTAAELLGMKTKVLEISEL